LRGDQLTQDFIDFEIRQAAALAMPLKPRKVVVDDPVMAK
jgi:hypothetical protein